MKVLFIAVIALVVISAEAHSPRYGKRKKFSNCLGILKKSCRPRSCGLKIPGTRCNLGLLRVFRAVSVPSSQCPIPVAYRFPSSKPGKGKVYRRKMPLSSCLCRRGCYFTTDSYKFKKGEKRGALGRLFRAKTTFACVVDTRTSPQGPRLLLARWTVGRSSCGNW